MYIVGMNIDEMIYERGLVREKKDWVESDRLRDVLDGYLVFVFDGKDGQEVYHLTERYFEFKDRKVETMAMNKRQYVEYLIKRDIRANNNFDAWLYSIRR